MQFFEEVSTNDHIRVTIRLLATNDLFLHRKIRLSHILRLKNDIEKNCNSQLKVVLSNLIYVGSISAQRAIIQHETKMYLCDTQKLR